jgi:hypothetical protein
LSVSANWDIEAASRFRRNINDIKGRSAIRTPPGILIDRVASF